MTVQTVTASDPLTAAMPRRALGRMPWEASLLTLGGVKWDTQIPEADAIGLIHRAIDLGVNTFDTAASYGRGQSEQRLGQALLGHRSNVWINTKTGQRSYDGARRDMDASLQRLKTDHIDLMLVHGLDNDEDYRKVLGPESVLKAIEEYRAAGHVRYVGVSGHWYKHNMARILTEYAFDAILCPVGLFNMAYSYSFVDEVVPVAHERGVAVLGMKVFGAGRVKHAGSIEPYLRYSLNQRIATAVIGCDSIEQLEQMVRIVKRQPPPLSGEEQQALIPEALGITKEWGPGEFNWVSHYVKQA